MAEHIKLRNITEVLEDAKLPHMRQEAAIELLSQWNDGPQGDHFQFYSIGSGKGGRVMIEPDIEPELVAWLRSGGIVRTRRSRGSGGDTPEPVVIREGIPVETLEEFRTRMTAFEEKLGQLEDMFLEGDARVDQLHKAVESVTEVYAKLRKEVDPKAMLPEPPALPPQYQYKVLIAGGDYRALQRVESNFRTIRFIHIEAGGAAGEIRLNERRTFPRVDAVFLLISYLGHSAENSLMKNYASNPDRTKRTPVHRVSGGVSGLESALSLWLSERKREAEEK